MGKKIIKQMEIQTTGKKAKVDMTISKSGRVLRPRKLAKQGITKEQFLTNLGKVCQRDVKG